MGSIPEVLVKSLSDFWRTEGGLGLPMGLAKRPQNQWDVPHTLQVRRSQAASRLRQPECWEYGDSARWAGYPGCRPRPDWVLKDAHRGSRYGLPFWTFLERTQGLG